MNVIILLVKKWLKHLHKGTRTIIVALGVGTALLTVVSIAFSAAYWGKILPGVSVVGINVGNKTGEQAAVMIEERLKKEEWLINLVYEGQEWKMDGSDLGISWDVPKTVNQAWVVGRDGNALERIGQAWESFVYGKKLDFVLHQEGGALDEIVTNIGDSIDVPLVMPVLSLESKNKEKVVVVKPGSDGRETDKEGLKNLILNKAKLVEGGSAEVPVRKLLVNLSEDKETEATSAAGKLLGKRLIFRLDGEEWVWGEDKLIGMVSVINGGGFDEALIAQAVENLSEGIDRSPQNAAFVFENGRVNVFKPGQDGLEVMDFELVKEVVDKYETLVADSEVEISIPVKRNPPVTATEDVNNLGIKELIGKGKSSYTHSIPNRVFNVGLAASRINGVIVPPGEEFSFNNSVGEISGITGYKSAYIISGGRTILGDGGGVCQVSTTIFRAALAAGLPITERRAHAYRVSYYEEDSLPGIDATVYSPTVDFKFKNDTPGYILIQANADSVKRKLTVDIYGTSDGRQATIGKPKVWSLSPAPAPVYQDDPSLATGVVKQIDWAAGGAKVSFDYSVKRGGEEIYSKTFNSNYQPWQAVFLRGTKI